ncbi:bactofilin family protein [Dichotomicrobium thermohalophilum]|uniref:Cytoskeletal protein CcmA (Bactofilin family) n=1 Tax=Dichotomicrobium thermohalophilum TaxID=933063 RepID=A0A397QF03_9HYPH|nr:polymer-forming cytoskeletal protein [Dichotomicrobium thermohalophilum]RIA56634.1 cytoskeletal protein CcmA (bactofilin family) [Dichotomicrobium thermohalophilum]
MSESVIGEDLTIIGNVKSKGNLKLDGKLQGDMYCASLIVSEKGRIDGGIVANNEVIVFGNVSGSIRSKRVMLHSTAHVEGDIYHQGIGIEMGTRYDGTLRWTEDPEAFTFAGDGKSDQQQPTTAETSETQQAAQSQQQAQQTQQAQSAQQQESGGRRLLRR